MESLLLFAALFILFMLFFYPVIVASSKVASVREDAYDAVKRVTALEKALAQMRERVTLLEGQASVPAAVPVPEPAPPPVIAIPEPEPVLVPVPAPPPQPAAAEKILVRAFADIPVPAPMPPVTPAWLLAARTWLFTGNLVAKFGLLILIIGIGFLVTYLAQHVKTTIELRVAGVVALDIGLLLWGWRIRHKRRDVALPVQGAALGILMLVVFGSFARLELIPAGLAFPLLVALTVFTCVLALLQDAIWLAVFGIAGGFAAPVLISTGSGNHIALFSYYALLNAGVLALALHRSWRVLNVLGFAATFVIGGAWGVTSYAPANYASTQGFLILFFLFYVAIAVAWARRRAPQFKDAVDATLVFGTPSAAFAMQYGLVKDTAFGMAFSSLALGLFYIGLALALQRADKARERYSLLIATFVALATIFGTLAVPFALTGTWTSAAWALEGAGLVWVGLRQGRALAWRFGLLVQGGASLAFLRALDAGMPGIAPVLLGAALLAVASVLISRLFRSNDVNHRQISNVFLAVAGAWWWGPALWAAAQLVELDFVLDPSLATPDSLPVAMYTMLVCVSALAAVTGAGKLAWPALRWFGVTGWVALAAASLFLLERLYEPTGWPARAQVLAWAFAWICSESLLRLWSARDWPLVPFWRKGLHLLRIGMPWLMLWPLLSRLIVDWLAVPPGQQDLLTLAGWRVSGSWSHFLPAWLMMLAVFVLAARSRTERWPVAPLGEWYRQAIIPAAACWFMLVALLWNLQQDGAMAPLPYLPLLNPLDLSTAFALLLWMASYRLWGKPATQPPLVALMPRIAAVAAWCWLNMVLVRTAAHFLAIDYNVWALADSMFIQAMLSLFWSISALVVMRRAGQLQANPRPLWMVGALLLGAVVAKLFLVDLSNTGSIARIVSFVGVGLLMVAIGYLAPYPAAASTPAQPAGSEA